MKFSAGNVPWNKGMNGFVHQGSFKKGHPQSNTGRTHFKKGSTPWSKNKQGIHLSPETEFKKGRQARHRHAVGTIIERKCKGKERRRFIKVKEISSWILLASYVWIKEHGPIPEGYFPHHIDGNPLNDSIENLRLVTRAEHCKTHHPGRTKNG